MNYQNQPTKQFQEQLNKFIIILKQQILNSDILNFQHQLYSYLNKQVKQQQSLIKNYIKPDQQNNQNNIHAKNLKQQIYKSETQKISYLLKQYLRVRIHKIQKYCYYLYKNQSLAEKKLSENQYTFMRGYAEMKFQYNQENILKNIVKPYRGLGGLQTFFSKTDQVKLQLSTKQSNIQLIEPQPNDYVFCKITGNPDLYRFNSDIPVTNVQQKQVIPINSTIYTQYKYVSKLISENNAVII